MRRSRGRTLAAEKVKAGRMLEGGHRSQVKAGRMLDVQAQNNTTTTTTNSSRWKNGSNASTVLDQAPPWAGPAKVVHKGTTYEEEFPALASAAQSRGPAPANAQTSKLAEGSPKSRPEGRPVIHCLPLASVPKANLLGPFGGEGDWSDDYAETYLSDALKAASATRKSLLKKPTVSWGGGGADPDRPGTVVQAQRLKRTGLRTHRSSTRR